MLLERQDHAPRLEDPLLERADVGEARQPELRDQPLHRRAARVGQRVRLNVGRIALPLRAGARARAAWRTCRRSSDRGSPGRSTGCTGCTRSSTACPRSSASAGCRTRATAWRRAARSGARAGSAGQRSVQKRHWSHADRPMRSTWRRSWRYHAISGWETGSTTTPPSVFVTGSSRLAARRPIMTPPSSTRHIVFGRRRRPPR